MSDKYEKKVQPDSKVDMAIGAAAEKITPKGVVAAAVVIGAAIGAGITMIASGE